MKTWCIGTLNADFMARMEEVLNTYSLPYDEEYPVISFDERPCFLIGDKVEGFELKAGQIRKKHYEYEKNGSCSLFSAIEPLTGKRLAKVYTYRRKIEYADFMDFVVSQYPNAKKIIVIQDNLNTHNRSSFYENFSAEKAFYLSQKLEFCYTPKKGSWLNVIETEFSALSRLCLNRRIPTKKVLEQQVLTFLKERTEKGIKINWSFSITDARRVFKRHYASICPYNY